MSLIFKLVIVIVIIVFIFASCLHLGVIKQKYRSGSVNGHIYVCPESPNCVSTSSSNKDTKHYIEPIKYTTELNIENLKDSILKAITSMPGSKLINSVESANYMHFQFKTFLGFIDDVEMLIAPEKKEIYFRSASRLGYSDFGANRKRYNQIKNKLSGVLR